MNKNYFTENIYRIVSVSNSCMALHVLWIVCLYFSFSLNLNAKVKEIKLKQGYYYIQPSDNDSLYLSVSISELGKQPILSKRKEPVYIKIVGDSYNLCSFYSGEFRLGFDQKYNTPLIAEPNALGSSLYCQLYKTKKGVVIGFGSLFNNKTLGYHKEKHSVHLMAFEESINQKWNFQFIGDIDKADKVKRYKKGVHEQIYEDGSIYVGEWNDGVQCGEGMLIYANSAKYYGGWQNGIRNGEGTMIYNELKFEDDYRVWKKKEYCGQWANGQYEGHGKLKDVQNDIEYEGGFLNGQFDGIGELRFCHPIYVNDRFYEKYNNDYKINEPCTYKGEFKQGKMNGKGKMRVWTRATGEAEEGPMYGEM